MVAITAAQPTRILPITVFAGTGRTSPSRFVKLLIDVVGAVVILAILLPVLLAVAIAIRLDGGPVFFTQTRIGRGGRTFRMVKFRSMIVNAEAVKQQLMSANEGSGPLFKMRNDPRITKVGHFIRKYSLDELPQLINVVTGSMSLIGPRPHLPAETAKYNGTVRRRLAVKPGLTGLWQVSGRSDLSWEESVRLDLHYVDDWSLALDAKIVAKTFGAVLAGKGAY